MSEKASRKVRKYAVSPEKFIEVWELAESAEEVAAKLQMPKPIVHARATNYRRAGVRLKSMPRRNRKSLNVESLNILIDKLAEKRKGK
jgi:hypothetical protein